MNYLKRLDLGPLVGPPLTNALVTFLFPDRVDYIPEGYVHRTSEWNDFIITNRVTSGLARWQHPRATEYKNTGYLCGDLLAH